jgi:membrane-associated phospholipid phosphatase
MIPTARSVVVLLAVAALLSAFAAGNGVLPGDAAIARGIQAAILPRGLRVAEAINWLGRAVPGTLVVTLAVAGLLFRKDARLEASVIAATLPLRLVNGGLKDLFHSARPGGGAVQVIERAHGQGYPSGHATGAVLLYGGIIAVAPYLTRQPSRCRLIRLAAVLMIVAAGISRVAVGAHWPSDVLGGYLWGGVLLGLLLLLYRWRRDTRCARPAVAEAAAHQRHEPKRSP